MGEGLAQTTYLPSLSDLDETSSWIAHEFRVGARECGWLVKRSGVESLFGDRKGALKIISREFSAAHLLLRSLPDMIARSRCGSFPVEAKAADSDTPNVAVELYQLLLFRRVAELGVKVWYCLGWPDDAGRLVGLMIAAERVRPWRIDVPARVNAEWPAMLREQTIAAARAAWPDAACRGGCLTAGSNDPYALIRKDSLDGRATIANWLRHFGRGQPFSQGERNAWEGQKDGRRPWPHVTRQQWKQWRQHDSNRQAVAATRAST